MSRSVNGFNLNEILATILGKCSQKYTNQIDTNTPKDIIEAMYGLSSLEKYISHSLLIWDRYSNILNIKGNNKKAEDVKVKERKKKRRRRRRK